MQTDSFFPYSWHIDEAETDITSIRIYGLNNTNENVCLRVDNFTPYVYIELPTKGMHCPQQLRSGKRKGSTCGRLSQENGYCKMHHPPQPLL